MNKPKNSKRQQFRKVYASGYRRSDNSRDAPTFSVTIPKSFCKLLSIDQNSIISFRLRGSIMILQKATEEE